MLRYVGLWATVWWALSGLYIVYVVWAARNYYAAYDARIAFSVYGWSRAAIKLARVTDSAPAGGLRAEQLSGLVEHVPEIIEAQRGIIEAVALPVH